MHIYEPVWFIFLLLIGAGLFIQYKNTGSLLTLSVSNVFYYFFFVYIVLGTISVYLKTESVTSQTTRYDEKIVYWVIFSVALCGLLVPLGNWIVSLFFERPLSQNLKAFLERKPEGMLQLGPLFLLILLCLLVFFLYARSLPQIPILSIVDGLSSEELGSLRSEASRNLSGKDHRYSIFFRSLLPFLCFVLFSWHLVYRKKALLTYSVIGITILALMVDLHKSPAGRFFVGLFFVYLLTRSKRLQPRLVLQFIAGVLLFAGVMMSFFMGHRDKPLSLVLKAVSDRVVGGQVRPLYYYFEMFPSLYDFLDGKGMPNPAGLFPFRAQSTTVLVHDHMEPVLKLLGINGSAPTIFYADFYVNFGFSGAIAIMLLVGLFFGLVDQVSTRKIKKDPLGIALFVWLGIHLSDLAGTSAAFLLFDIRLMLILTAYFFVRFFTQPSKTLQPYP